MLNAVHACYTICECVCVVCIQFNARKTRATRARLAAHANTHTHVRTHIHILFPFGNAHRHTTIIRRRRRPSATCCIHICLGARRALARRASVYTIAYTCVYAVIELVATTLLIHARAGGRARVRICVVMTMASTNFYRLHCSASVHAPHTYYMSLL